VLAGRAGGRRGTDSEEAEGCEGGELAHVATLPGGADAALTNADIRLTGRCTVGIWGTASISAYAAAADVVAVIGTLNSPCADAALPELNRARGGPLAMVSPLNSFVGLTRAGPGVPPDLLASLYPTGRRNYLRAYPTDDLQGAALALLAPDGLTPLPLLARSAGPAARGVFVSLAGAVTERLPAAGAAFVRRFAQTQAGRPVEPAAVYAAGG
jgi:hypothetical protein